MPVSFDTIILAGGIGSRLQGVVSDRPKCLAEINGRPFLAYLLDQLGRRDEADRARSRALDLTTNQVERAFLASGGREL